MFRWAAFSDGDWTAKGLTPSGSLVRGIIRNCWPCKFNAGQR